MAPLPESPQLHAFRAYLDTVPRAVLDTQWRRVATLHLTGASLAEILDGCHVWQAYLRNADKPN